MIFIEKRERQNKNRKSNLRNDQKRFDYFLKREKPSLALLKSHGESIRLEQIKKRCSRCKVTKYKVSPYYGSADLCMLPTTLLYALSGANLCMLSTSLMDLAVLTVR